MLRLGMLATLTLIASGCAGAVSERAICDGTAALLRDHAAALAEDGGPQSIVTGRRLIEAMDAGCAAR